MDKKAIVELIYKTVGGEIELDDIEYILTTAGHFDLIAKCNVLMMELEVLQDQIRKLKDIVGTDDGKKECSQDWKTDVFIPGLNPMKVNQYCTSETTSKGANETADSIIEKRLAQAHAEGVSTERETKDKNEWGVLMTDAWHPCLAQLLYKIRQQNYNIQMGLGDMAHVHVMHREKYINKAFHADTLEDAATKALLWILNNRR